MPFLSSWAEVPTELNLKPLEESGPEKRQEVAQPTAGSASEAAKPAARTQAPALKQPLESPEILKSEAAENSRLPNAWAHEWVKDLPLDPRAHCGSLANGMKYVIYPNQEPAKRVALRLLVWTGSLFETDAQQGIAHYLEHLAFNGSKHFPAGELIHFFQKIGMSFGADTNAFTSFDQTAYQIDLPEATDEYLKEGFKVFRDFADGLLLDEAQVEKERGIILSEKRERDSVDYRTWVAQFKLLLPDSRIPFRLPIGLEDNIQSFKAADLRAFYKKWYRPDRITLLVVGPVEPKAIEPLVQEAFGSMAAPKGDSMRPSWGQLTPRGLAVSFLKEPELSAATVSLDVLKAPVPADSWAQRVKSIRQEWVSSIINQRLSVLQKRLDAPFISASFSRHPFLNAIESSSMDLSCKPEQIQDCVQLLEQEIRKILDYGFTENECEQARLRLLNVYQEHAKREPTFSSSTIAAVMLRCLADQIVITAPKTDLELAQAALKNFSPQDLWGLFKEDWETEHLYLTVNSPKALEDPAGEAKTPEAYLEQIFNESRKTQLTVPENKPRPVFAYEDWGPSGEVVAEKKDADLDIHQLEFSNGVRLNFKKTDFKKNSILVNLKVGAGLLELPLEQSDLAWVGDATLIAGGLGKHSSEDLEAVLAGKNIHLFFNVAEDAFEFSLSTTPEDLALGLKFLCAYLTDPGYRPEALAQARKRWAEGYELEKYDVDLLYARKQGWYLSSKDPRFGAPEQKKLMARELSELKTVLDTPFKEGAMEVSIVGDFQPDVLIEACKATLGALPQRKTEKAAWLDRRQVRFPERPAEPIRLEVESKIPRGLVSVSWPTGDYWAVEDRRALNLLRLIFKDRLREVLREEMNQTYSPRVIFSPSLAYTGYGLLTAEVGVEPGSEDRMAEAIERIAKDLYLDGITEDEFTRAKTPLLNELRDSLRENSYWLCQVLDGSTEHPELFDWAKNRQEAFQALTEVDLEACATRYLVPGKAVRIYSLPKQAAKGESKPQDQPLEGQEVPPSGEPKVPSESVPGEGQAQEGEKTDAFPDAA